MTLRHATHSTIATWRLGALFAGAALLALSCATPAQAFIISVNETITSTAPSFGDSTFTGESIFTADGSVRTIFPSSRWPGPDLVGNICIPPCPALPGAAVIWQFGGTLVPVIATADGSVFPVDAFALGTTDPGDPVTPPLITIALDLLPGFAPFDVSGPIFAFDAAELVGTWKISVSEVPEPSTLFLLGAGLGALAFVRRRRARVPAPS
jgi:hypothetical protein